MASLGNTLKEHRKNLRITLREAEKNTGISNAYLSQVENGKINQPTPKILRKLSDYYNLSYLDLMKLAGHPVISSNPNKINRKLSSEFENLTPSEESELKDYLKFIRERRKRK